MTKEALETVAKMRAISEAREIYVNRDFEDLPRDYLEEWYDYTLISEETAQSYEVGKIFWEDEVLEVVLSRGKVFDWDYATEV